MKHVIVCAVQRAWVSDVIYFSDLVTFILSSSNMHVNRRYECVLSFLPCTTGASSEPTLDDSADRYMCRAQESMSYECADEHGAQQCHEQNLFDVRTHA